MIRFSILLAALALPAAAHGQDTLLQSRLDLVGEAPSACVVRAASALASENASFSSQGASGGEIRIRELVNAETAEPRSVRVDLAVPIVCNAPHRVVLRSLNGGLRREGATAATGAGFRDFLAYDLSASWSAQTVARRSDNQSDVVIPSSYGYAGDLALVLSIGAGGDPLVAGAYGDQIVIQVQAAN